MTPLLQEAITAQATRNGEARAVVMGQHYLSYRQLDRSSTQLAKALKDAGCKRGDRVGLLMQKSLPAIVSIMGILKADCAYVPIDPQSPAPRVRKILDQCEPRVILCAGSAGALLADVLGQETSPDAFAVGWLGPGQPQSDHLKVAFTQADCERYLDTPINYTNPPADPAYIMFTSGSTGTPKGVVITHANVDAYRQWAIRYFAMGSSDKMSGHPPLHFDLSVMDIFCTLSVGAELHLFPQELNLLPNKIAEFIRRSELTQWFSVPSVLSFMTKFDVVKAQDFPALKRVLWCGEVLPTPSLIYWMNRLPHVRFTNLYGPTEATIASSFHTVPVCPHDPTASIPIGKACEGEELLVLDPALRPMAVDEIGDLYIRGKGLSPGYWKDEQKTRSVFVLNPNGTDPDDRLYRTGDLARLGPDGLVYFHGRSDTQIKSRGYRIELGEIESALHSIPHILQECAVVAINAEGFEGATICCAYVSSDQHTITTPMLQKALGAVLPPYMIPSRYLSFDILPKNASGKIDRPRLREYFLAHKLNEGRIGA